MSAFTYIGLEELNDTAELPQWGLDDYPDDPIDPLTDWERSK